MKWFSFLFIFATVAFLPQTARSGQPGKASAAEKAAAKDTIKAAVPAMRQCYETELKTNKNLEGKMVFALDFDEDGSLREVRVVEDKLGSAVVAACIMTRLREIKRLEAAAGGTVEIPLLFAPTRTLAVLPFDNVTGDKSIEWLRNGISESLISKLGQVPKLVLVDRMKLDAILGEQALGQSGAINETSAAKTGKLAGAQLVITGGCQNAGDKIRLTARIVDVETGKVRGATDVTGRLKDIFDLQDRLAAKIAELMNISRTPETDNALALRIGGSAAVLELLGKAYNALSGIGEPKDPKKAEALFRQVTTADPKVPEAYVGLARSLAGRKDDEAQKDIQSALEQAIKLRPDYYEAITMLGFHLWRNLKIDESFELHKKAVQLKPDYALGIYGLAIQYASKGKANEAIEMCRQAVELDPGDSELLTQYGLHIAVFKRDFAEALKHTGAALGLRDLSEWNFIQHAYVRMMAGDAAGCIETIEEGRKWRERNPAEKDRFAAQSLTVEAACKVKRGNVKEAASIFEGLPDEGLKKVWRMGEPWPEDIPAFVRIQWKDVLEALGPALPEK